MRVGFRENPRGAAGLAAFLALPVNNRDVVIDPETFKTLTPLQRSRPTKKIGVPLTKFHTLVTDGNRLDPKPETLIFVEKAAVLKNSTGKGTSWNVQGVAVKKIP